MIQNVNSLNTLLKLSCYINTKSIIAGGFLLILVLFSVSCSNDKDEKIESSEATFDECISLNGAVIYKNYLILVGENANSDCSVRDVWYTVKYGKNTRVFVYDLLTDKRDDDFRQVIQLDNLIRYYVRNDSLFAETKSNKYNETNWWFLNGDKWIETNPFPSSERFNKSCLKRVCHQIFEDSVYVIYGYDQGEFGNAVLFLEKKTGIVRGYPMRSARKALKDTSGYLILGICYHMMESFEVLRIPNPELLPIVPDSLIRYNCPDNEDFEQNNLENYLKDQIIRSFPEKICKKINIAKSSEYIYSHSCPK